MSLEEKKMSMHIGAFLFDPFKKLNGGITLEFFFFKKREVEFKDVLIFLFSFFFVIFRF